MVAEQLQISYINTTYSGINMIASWIKLNYTTNNNEKINYLTKYNSDPNIFISLTQYNFLFPTISLFFLGLTSISSLIIFYFCNLCYSKKNNYLNVTDSEKALDTSRDNINNIDGIKGRKTLFKLFKTYNYFGFFICLLTGFIDINYNHISYAPNGESIKYCLNNNCTIHLAQIKTLNTQNINRNLYHAEMNNLIPNQKYTYCVGSDQIGWSNPISFNTFEPGYGINKKFSTAIYGDFGFANSQSLYQLQQYLNNDDYKMVLHIGDMAYNLDTDDGQVGDNFMNKIQPISSVVPYMTCPGNHESANNFLHYKQRYNMPGMQSKSGFDNNFYYSFDVGNIHYVAISSELYYYSSYFNNDVLIKQYNWLINDLKKASKSAWKIVFAHRPMYCSIDTNDGVSICTSDTEILRDGTTYNGGNRVAPLEHVLKDYNVDFFFAGHMHSYERLWPTYRQQVLQNNYYKPKAPIHIVTGSAGCNENLDSYDKTDYPWSAFKSDSYGFGILDIFNNSVAEWRQINAIGGGILDKITVVK